MPIVYRRATGNLGTVTPGRVYRSAQLGPEQLTRVIQQRGIRTVLNLRGANPDQSWYRAESAATVAAGATQVDVPMASDQWLSREQIATLLEVLDSADEPILVHCEFGAERTGLISALIELLRPGSTLDSARAQFSVRYLFLPLKDGLVMRGHLDAYEAWLGGEGAPHRPERFRHWLTAVYRPGTPSREYWPCNPYPRKVVTARAADGSTHAEADLSDAACPQTVHSGAEPAGSRRR